MVNQLLTIASRQRTTVKIDPLEHSELVICLITVVNHQYIKQKTNLEHKIVESKIETP